MEPAAEPTLSDDRIGRSLASQGTVAWLTMRGRTSGEPRSVAVGFIDGPDGSILVAANGPDHDWGLNLLAEPLVRVEIGSRTFDARAEPLGRDDHVRTIRELILRYGTPAEGLGSGPSFRLRPVEPEGAG